MKESEITDEQILQEMKEILVNPQLRKCSQCANANDDCSWCSQLKKPLAKYMYAGMCSFYETNEERIIKQTREALKKHEKKEKKINYILTLCLTTLSASLLYLDHFQDMVEEEYTMAEKKGVGDEKVRKADRAWMSTIKRAMKAMKAHVDGVQKQYQHYIMPTYNKVFFDKETGKYDVESYDDHQSDLFEVAEMNMRYYDAAFLNLKNATKIKEIMRGLATCRVFEEEDYKRYNFRR